jgi:hypothetical protein
MKTWRQWSAVVAAVVLAGCVGPGREHKLALNEKIAVRNWDGAVAQLDQAQETEYGEKNSVLFWLDKATVLHDAGRYPESDALLDLAERRMDELYTRSLSRGAATFLVNDGADIYAGQVHERTLLHVLRALNYAYLGKLDDAVVEARKVSAFLTELNDRLGDQPLAYRDDGFAQYLSGLLFEDQGRADDARICYDASRSAWAGYQRAWGMPVPVLDAGAAATPTSLVVPAALTVSGGAPAGTGELVFLHYVGVAPRRETQTLQIAWGKAMAIVHESKESREDPRVKNALVAGISSDAITVAIPTFVQDPSLVAGSEIEVAGRRAQTVLVEDVTAIARSALAAALPRITAKAVARATVKFLVAKVAEKEMKKQLGDGWGALAGLAMRAGAAATEVADTRGWAALPAQFRMARVRVPEGTHAVKVSYLSAQGGPAGEEILPAVRVKAGQRTYVHVRTAGAMPVGLAAAVTTAAAVPVGGEAVAAPARVEAASPPAAAAAPAAPAADAAAQPPAPAPEAAPQAVPAPAPTDVPAPAPEVAPAAAPPPAAIPDVPLPPPPPGTTYQPRADAGPAAQ